MTRRSKRLGYLALAGLVLGVGLFGVGLFALTPVGPWAFTRLLARIAASRDWTLTVEDCAGSLAGGFALTRVRAASPTAGVHLAIERLEFAPWSYAVVLVRPEVQLELREGEEKEKEEVVVGEPPRLPVDYFPDLSVVQGHLEVAWKERGQRLTLGDLEIGYRALDDTSGQLAMQAARLALIRDGQTVVQGKGTVAVFLGPATVAIDSLQMATAVDTLDLEIRAEGRLALLSGYPARARLRGRAESRSGNLAAALEAQAEGWLEPLDLRVALGGQARHPLLQEVTLKASATLGKEVLALDSLALGLLGGRVVTQATYYPAVDSLASQTWIQGLELSRLLPALKAGPLDGSLRAALNLGEKRGDADLRLLLHQFAALPGKPMEVEMVAQHSPDRQTRVELRSPILALTAAGWVDPATFPGPGSGVLEINGVAHLDPLLALEAEPVRIQGQMRPDSLFLHLDTPHLPGPIGQKFGPLHLALELRDNRFLKVRSTLEQNLLVLHLQMDLAQKERDTLVAVLSPLSLSRLVPGLEAQIQGQVRTSGLLAPSELHLDSRFETGEVAYGNWRTEPLNLSLAYRQQRLLCRLEGSGLHLETWLDPHENLSGRIIFDGPVLYRQEEADTLPQPAAILEGTLEWQGHLDRLERAEAHLNLERLVVRQGKWEVQALEPLRLEYSDERLRFAQVHLQTPIGPLKVAGSAQTEALDALVEFPSLELHPLSPALSLAEGEGSLTLRGSIRRPLLDGDFELRQLSLDTLALGDLQGQIAMRDTLTLRLALFQKGRATPAAELALAAPAEPLVQGLTDTSQGKARLEFAAKEMELDALLSHFLQQKAQGHLGLEGKVSVPLARLDSSLSWRDLRGDVHFHQLQLETVVEGNPVRLGMLPGGSMLMDEDHLGLQAIEMEIARYERTVGDFVPAGRLRLGGGLQGTSGSPLRLDLEDLDLLLLDGPEGKAKVQALISGTMEQPEIEVDLEVKTEDLGVLQGQWLGGRDEAPFWLDWISPLGDSLKVRGELPWNRGKGGIDYERARMHLNSAGFGLRIFSDLLAKYQIDYLDGRLAVDLEVGGLGEAFALEGYLAVEDLQFALLDLKPVYLFPQGRLEFRGRRGEFLDFTSPPREGNGRMTLSGQIDLSSPTDPRYAVRLQTEDLVCQYLDLFRAPEIDMDIALEGSLKASRLAGRVRMKEALAEPVLVAFNAPPVPPPPPTLRDEFLENMALALFVDIRDLKVDSELAKVQISGAIDVGGTFYKPIFQGDLQIDQGQVFILNRQFDFERGRIVLNSLVPTRSILDVAYDPFLLNPDLDLVASCKVVPIDEEDAEYTITLNLQGAVQTAAPEFTSVPALDFNSIFRLLAFGSVSSQLEYSAALGTAAGQLLSKQVEKVGLDEFTVLPSTRPEIGTVGQPSLRLGKYFDQIPFPLWVRYEASIREISSGEVRIEYKLRPYLTFSGTAQSKYDRYGLGLGLKKDF